MAQDSIQGARGGEKAKCPSRPCRQSPQAAYRERWALRDPSENIRSRLSRRDWQTVGPAPSKFHPLGRSATHESSSLIGRSALGVPDWARLRAGVIISKSPCLRKPRPGAMHTRYEHCRSLTRRAAGKLDWTGAGTLWQVGLARGGSRGERSGESTRTPRDRQDRGSRRARARARPRSACSNRRRHAGLDLSRRGGSGARGVGGHADSWRAAPRAPQARRHGAAGRANRVTRAGLVQRRRRETGRWCYAAVPFTRAPPAGSRPIRCRRPSQRPDRPAQGSSPPR